MEAKQKGTQPSSPCAQLEHLSNLLRNRVNSQWNSSLYEVWRPKIAQDIENLTVRQLHWDSKIPGIFAGTKADEAWPSPAPATGYREESQSTSSLPYQSRKGSPAPGGSWVVEVAGRNTDKVGDTHRRYTSSGPVDASPPKMGVPGNTWRKEEFGRMGP